MRTSERARRVIRDMERVSPYMYEGLYGNFLGHYMEGDKSRWTHDLSRYLAHSNQEWTDIGDEIAVLLWDQFERRISC